MHHLRRTGRLAWVPDAELIDKLPRRVREVFPVLLGCKPKQYLICVRTELGLDLVKQGLKVADAAERAGFSDSSKFIHACHKVVGCTPLQFVRANGWKPGSIMPNVEFGER